MDKEVRKEGLKRIAAKLGTEEDIDLLARVLVPVFSFDESEIGKGFLSVYNDIPVKDMPSDYIAEEFKATQRMLYKILNACGDLKKALKGELDEKKPAAKKSYK